MLCAFIIGFEKIWKSCLLLLEALPGLVDNPLRSCYFEGTRYDYDVATKVRGTEEFSHRDIADLNSGITVIVLFSQEKPLW